MYWKTKFRTPELFVDVLITTGEEADQYLGQRYPDCAFYLMPIDSEIANEATLAIQSLFDTYPNARPSQIIISERVPSEALADYDNEMGERGCLYFSPDFGDARKLEKLLMNEEIGHWHPKGGHTIGSVIAHEYGHSLYYKIMGVKEFAQENFDEAYTVSEYAEQSESEFLAEIFSENFSNLMERSNISIKFGEWLKAHSHEL